VTIGSSCFFPEISNVADMGSRSFRKNLPWRCRTWREALGGTSNEINSVNLLVVHTRARLALDLISTLAGILERAEDIKTGLSSLLAPKVLTGTSALQHRSLPFYTPHMSNASRHRALGRAMPTGTTLCNCQCRSTHLIHARTLRCPFYDNVTDN